MMERPDVIDTLERYAPESYDPATDDMTVPFAILLAEKDAEIERLRAELVAAELAVRAWHQKALELRDLSITGKCSEIERVYFDAAMLLPFYGGGDDPTPSQRRYEQSYDEAMAREHGPDLNRER